MTFFDELVRNFTLVIENWRAKVLVLAVLYPNARSLVELQVGLRNAQARCCTKAATADT